MREAYSCLVRLGENRLLVTKNGTPCQFFALLGYFTGFAAKFQREYHRDAYSPVLVSATTPHLNLFLHFCGLLSYSRHFERAPDKSVLFVTLTKVVFLHWQSRSILRSRTDFSKFSCFFCSRWRYNSILPGNLIALEFVYGYENQDYPDRFRFQKSRRQDQARN